MIFDMPSCGGCRTCELACSFHHRSEFAPSHSSLKILEKTDGPGYRVLIKERADEDGPACDGCRGLDVPLCMDYCKEADDLYRILQTFDEERPQEGEAGGNLAGERKAGHGGV